MFCKVADLHRIAEVQTVFHFDTSFHKQRGANPFTEKGNPSFLDITDIEGAVLRARCTAAALPKGVHTRIDVNTHGYTFPSPGRVNRNGDITLTFFETVGAEVISMMMGWHDALWSWGTKSASEDGNEQGKQQGSYDDMFGDVVLDLHNKSENNKTQRYWLHGCIIADIDPGGDLSDGSSPDYFKPVLNIGYAWFNWEPFGAKASGTPPYAPPPKDKNQ